MILSIAGSISALLTFAPVGGGATPEMAAYRQVRCIKAPCPPACPKGSTALPDERRTDRVVCISDRERARARKICKELKVSDWTQCTCQDGNKVGACGD
jgi:hypothetical protein